MKQYTTPEQTAKLIELGFARPRIAAPGLKWEDGVPTIYPQYTIGELIKILPENVAKENEMPSTLNISLMNGEWCVQYADFLGTDFEFCNTELIDALYDMCVKLKEKGVI
ncbi:MAG: hypothetical protein E7141_04845 [Rikenellaceae bacterium]|nr:hypothetical protein [Rikenellaceae bacterium]